MPTVLRDGGYRYYFLSGDRGEPPHVHVQGGDGFAKFWLSPIALSTSGNLSPRELRRIERTVGRHQTSFLEAWDEFFSD